MKVMLLSALLFFTTALNAQQNYWQQQLKYNIKASLNDEKKLITATENIVYKNNSPVALEFIWFHLWPNAYKNDNTALLQQIKNDAKRKEKLTNYGKGSIEGLNFTIDGIKAVTQPHPNPIYIDIVKLVLNKPLQPGDSINIATDFKVMLPPYFSRSGYADGEFMACQWYPKPAVYDKDGWHEMPYLDMGEFYSEYGDYDVTLTIPSDYIVSATGILQTESELARYKELGSKNASARNKKPALYEASRGSAKTLNWKAYQVPDFAWFADKNFVIEYDTIQLVNNQPVDAFSFYHNKKGTIWMNSIDYIKDAVHKYSEWVGTYGYPVVQVVEGPKNNSSGGMEYPMVTLITSPDAKVETLDAVIAHEIGHNWFMSMLGTNERAHTWMDEGLNSYIQFRYEAEKYRSNAIFGDAIPREVKKLSADEFQNVIYNIIDKNIPMKSAMDIPADQFPDSEEYGLVSYVKTALWMHLLEASVGREKVDLALHNYFNKWKDKHPQPVDMQSAFEEAIGTDLSNFFKLVHKEGALH